MEDNQDNIEDNQDNIEGNENQDNNITLKDYEEVVKYHKQNVSEQQKKHRELDIGIKKSKLEINSLKRKYKILTRDPEHYKDLISATRKSLHNTQTTITNLQIEKLTVFEAIAQENNKLKNVTTEIRNIKDSSSQNLLGIDKTLSSSPHKLVEHKHKTVSRFLDQIPQTKIETEEFNSLNSMFENFNEKYQTLQQDREELGKEDPLSGQYQDKVKNIKEKEQQIQDEALQISEKVVNFKNQQKENKVALKQKSEIIRDNPSIKQKISDSIESPLPKSIGSLAGFSKKGDENVEQIKTDFQTLSSEIRQNKKTRDELKSTDVDSSEYEKLTIKNKEEKTKIDNTSKNIGSKITEEMNRQKQFSSGQLEKDQLIKQGMNLSVQSTLRDAQKYTTPELQQKQFFNQLKTGDKKLDKEAQAISKLVEALAVLTSSAKKASEELQDIDIDTEEFQQKKDDSLNLQVKSQEKAQEIQKRINDLQIKSQEKNESQEKRTNTIDVLKNIGGAFSAFIRPSLDLVHQGITSFDEQKVAGANVLTNRKDMIEKAANLDASALVGSFGKDFGVLQDNLVDVGKLDKNGDREKSTNIEKMSSDFKGFLKYSDVVKAGASAADALTSAADLKIGEAISKGSGALGQTMVLTGAPQTNFEIPSIKKEGKEEKSLINSIVGNSSLGKIIETGADIANKSINVGTSLINSTTSLVPIAHNVYEQKRQTTEDINTTTKTNLQQQSIIPTAQIVQKYLNILPSMTQAVQSGYSAGGDKQQELLESNLLKTTTDESEQGIAKKYGMGTNEFLQNFSIAQQLIGGTTKTTEREQQSVELVKNIKSAEIQGLASKEQSYSMLGQIQQSGVKSLDTSEKFASLIGMKVAHGLDNLGFSTMVEGISQVAQSSGSFSGIQQMMGAVLGKENGAFDVKRATGAIESTISQTGIGADSLEGIVGLSSSAQTVNKFFQKATPEQKGDLTRRTSQISIDQMQEDLINFKKTGKSDIYSNDSQFKNLSKKEQEDFIKQNIKDKSIAALSRPLAAAGISSEELPKIKKEDPRYNKLVNEVMSSQNIKDFKIAEKMVNLDIEGSKGNFSSNYNGDSILKKGRINKKVGDNSAKIAQETINIQDINTTDKSFGTENIKNYISKLPSEDQSANTINNQQKTNISDPNQQNFAQFGVLMAELKTALEGIKNIFSGEKNVTINAKDTNINASNVNINEKKNTRVGNAILLGTSGSN